MIQEDLWSLPMAGALDLYEKSKDWSAGDVRELCKLDRFFLLSCVMRRADAVHPWLYARCREVERDPDGYLDLWAREHYKAVDVDELVPTPYGFRRHGDLLPGDIVFGADGEPTRVIARTPVFTDADCYRVTFDDGYSVVVSGAHLWAVEKLTRKRNAGGWRKYRENVTVSTKDMAEAVHTAGARLAVPVARCKGGNRKARQLIVSSVDAVSTIPVSCIQVAAPDGLYLIGRNYVTTHNSTIITFAGSIQEIIKDPEITIGIFSFNKPVARKFIAQIKHELENNQLIRSLFPDIFWSNPWRDAPQWSSDRGLIVKRKGNPKESTIEGHGLVDGQPTGAHFKLRIYDDVVTLDSVTSPEMVRKTTEAWSLSDNLGARPESGVPRAWHVGTRYRFADTYQTIIDMGAVKRRIYPATDSGLPDGKPVFLSPEVWAEKKQKQIGSVLAAQMLQNPAAGNQATFKKEWLRFADVRPSTLNVYILCDPASSRKKDSDNTAIAVIGVDAGSNKWLLDGFHHKMGLSDRYQKIRLLRKHWNAMPGVQLVKVGYERYGSTSDIEYFEEAMERDKDHFPIHELAWPREGPGSKHDRIQRLEPDFRAGRFYLAAMTPTETRRQQEARTKGKAFLIFSPVRRVDHEGRAYSLNRSFIEQYLVEPFGSHEDLLDAVSRIYDIDHSPPVIIDQRQLEPEAYEDAA